MFNNIEFLLVKSPWSSNNIHMSSGKEGKIPALRKELMKALEVWDSKDSFDDKVFSEQKKEEFPQKNQLLSSIKAQLDKLSL